jgi:hypothetical protein
LLSACAVEPPPVAATTKTDMQREDRRTDRARVISLTLPEWFRECSDERAATRARVRVAAPP